MAIVLSFLNNSPLDAPEQGTKTVCCTVNTRGKKSSSEQNFPLKIRWRQQSLECCWKTGWTWICSHSEIYRQPCEFVMLPRWLGCYFLYVSDITTKDQVEKGKLIWLFILSEQRFWVQMFVSVCVGVWVCSSLTSVECWSLWSGAMNEKRMFRFITLSYTFAIWKECSFQSLSSTSSFSI